MRIVYPLTWAISCPFVCFPPSAWFWRSEEGRESSLSSISEDSLLCCSTTVPSKSWVGSTASTPREDFSSDCGDEERTMTLPWAWTTRRRKVVKIAKTRSDILRRRKDNCFAIACFFLKLGLAWLKFDCSIAMFYTISIRLRQWEREKENKEGGGSESVSLAS